MTRRNLILLGNPILRQKAKKLHRFDPSVQKLAAEMFETMHAHHGIGLAAPQIGLLIRLFVVECDDSETGKHRKLALANPVIIKAVGEQQGVDACFKHPWLLRRERPASGPRGGQRAECPRQANADQRGGVVGVGATA